MGGGGGPGFVERTINTVLTNTTNPRNAWDELDPLSLGQTGRRYAGEGDDQKKITQTNADNDTRFSEQNDLDNNADAFDHQTQQDIQDQINSGSFTSAAKTLSDAKKGTGMYAVRKIDENQKKLLDMRPGRAQLSQRYSLISGR